MCLKTWLQENILHGKGFIWDKQIKTLSNEVILEIELRTSFIKEGAIKDRVSAILGDIYTLPLCIECEKELLLRSKKTEEGFVLTDRVYCSKECNQGSLIARKKREQTCLERFGNKNIFGTEIGKEKVKEGLFRNYGVSHPQKHKLKNILKEFNPLCSEWKNMHEHGFDKIYDCGNLVYIK